MGWGAEASRSEKNGEGASMGKFPSALITACLSADGKVWVERARLTIDEENVVSAEFLRRWEGMRSQPKL